ncbi:MAG: hypothetical protein Q8K99_05020 [Actinomycetota bacterium]|nr:hypothetical protein [Actinomycetota bacterium]
MLRLLQAIQSARLADGLVGLVDDEVAGAVTREALGHLPDLFGRPDSPGSQLAAEAAAPEPSEVITASCVALCRELLGALRERGIQESGGEWGSTRWDSPIPRPTDRAEEWRAGPLGSRASTRVDRRCHPHDVSPADSHLLAFGLL